MSDNKVIDFFEANNKLWAKEHKEGLNFLMDATIGLTILKIKGMQVSGNNEPIIIEEIPYTMNEVSEAIDIANEYIVSNYSSDDVCKLTSIPDELSRLAVEYLIGEKMITLNDLGKTEGGFK